MTKALLLPLVPILLAGCAGSPKYACGVPEGVGCRSVGAIYEASVTGTLPSARGTDGGEAESNEPEATERPSATAEISVVETVQPGDPLLSRPQVLRVWIDRWEDAAGDLHDETYLYLRLDSGNWRLGQ
jgi:conjugal transfer pilus assembly protein TraV